MVYVALLSSLYADLMDFNSNSKEASELLKAQAHIWNHTFSFVNSMSLKCAIQLDIPDVINKHGKAMTLPELVEALHINKAKEECVHRLMRVLVHSGFFQISENMNDKEAGYLLTSSSRFLLKDELLSVRPFYLANLDAALLTPWQSLSQWFRGGKDATAFEMTHGQSLWDYAGDHPDFNNNFNRGMASDTLFVINVMIKDCKGIFEGIHSLVDVGGGTGTMAIAIADAFPRMYCTVFDLPHVVDNLEGRSNLSYVGGDMFEAIPKADVFLLKWILHDWNDDECLKILSRCKEAIPSKEKGGKVVIIDIVLVDDIEKGDHTGIQTQLYFDMILMVGAGGKERTENNWKVLFQNAGFSDYKITPLLGLRCVIELFP